MHKRLFPFDGCRGFGADVVNHTVDAFDSVDDVVGDFGEELVGEMAPVGGHTVDGFDGAERDDALIGAFVAHHTDGLNWKEHASGLPDFVVEVVVAEALNEDVVDVLEDADFLGGDVAQDADGEAWPGEGVAADEFLLDAELAADAADFVFEEAAEGFDELELHIVGESAHVVVGLDGLGGAFDGAGLDYVGVDGALAEPFGVGYEFGFGVEDVDEGLADGLAFLFGVGYAGEDAVEAFFGVDAFHVEAHIFVGFEDVLELVFAEEAVVDEYAVELVADGFVEEDGCDGGVDSAAEAEDDFVGADFLAELADCGFDEGFGGPLLGAVADADDEVFEDGEAVGGVMDFGMELDGVGFFAFDVVAGEMDVIGGADAVVVFGEGLDGVAVAHPDLAAQGYVFHEGRGVVDGLEVGASVFADFRLLDLAAAEFGEILGAVAYAEEGQLALDIGHIGDWGVGGVAAVGAAGKDYAFDVGSQCGNFVKWVNFAIDIQFAHLARDELSVLRTKV